MKLMCCDKEVELVYLPAHDFDTWVGYCTKCDSTWSVDNQTGSCHEDDIREIIEEEKKDEEII